MARASSEDLRQRVVEAVMAGATCRVAAARYQVSVSFVVKLMQRWRGSGSVAARSVGGQRPYGLADHAELVRLTGDRRAGRHAGGAASPAGEQRCSGRPLVDRPLPHQPRADAKKKTQHAAEQARADVAEARAAWRAGQPSLSPARPVFVDGRAPEAIDGATTNMARRYGRSPRGRRMVASVPPSDRSAVCPSGGSLRDGHWQTSTFVAGLRQDGITAPCVLDGAINGRTFRAWVEQFLAPTLRAGDVVVLDNLSSHKIDGVREAIEARGATMRHLPPYSPDLNPIEQAFAKLKAHLRRIAARSRETLWASMGQVLDTITPTECQNYIVNAGYCST